MPQTAVEMGQELTPRRRRIVRHAIRWLQLVAINFAIFALLAEVASIAVVHLNKWPSSRPTYRLAPNEFWADVNPAFGIWHRANGHFFHQGGCFSVEYRTNSYGARDIERTIHSAQPRTIVLGDSFVEGFGLPDHDRLTNILEARTGREHLNFGTGGGFSPLQYALVYRTLASRFDHTQVLVGILPDNDFHEMDRDWLARMYSGQYRPYYTNNLSIAYMGHFDPRSRDGLADRTEAAMRAYLASYHVGQYLYASRFYWRTRNAYSGYNDYTPTELAKLQAALSLLKRTAAAHHAQLTVFLIPRANDFARLHQAGTNRVGPALEQWGGQAGIPIKDLLPEMDNRANGNYRSYFLECDGHWSARGSEVAADILEHWMYGKG